MTPPYSELLKFLDTQAKHSESLVQPGRRQYVPSKQKPAFKSRTSYAALTENHCSLCKSTRHPLYACRVFQRFSHDAKLKKIKEEGLRMNCFGKGHLARQCTAATMCTKCSCPHHSIIHLEPKKLSSSSSKRSPSPPPEDLSSSTGNHTSITDTPKPVLLMTCQLKVISPDGLETKATVLIDPGSSTSFVSEHLVQHLRLPRKNSFIRIVGIGGISCDS